MSVKEKRAEWHETLPPKSKEADAQKPILYTSEDVEIDYEKDLGFPGQYPFTRGIYPAMYQAQHWRMIQQAGFV